MRVLLNIFWLVFGGLFIAIGYAIAGIICFILIITIPFGVAAFRMANYALWPFGRTIRPSRRPASAPGSATSSGSSSPAGGWRWATSSPAIAQFITIIGIPLGLANIKLVPVSLFPLGHEIVDVRDE